MQSNLSVQPYRPAFKANVSESLIGAAESYYQKNYSPRGYNLFYEAVKRFNKLPNTDSITIGMKKIYSNGKKQFALYAKEEDTGRQVVLSQKDQFRKLLEKFTHINEYEFNLKMGRNTK